ncbi:MAG: hypothetical protein MPI95_00870 [Nitrosopumilus sp.]|nr:hypothetical protein [Nitrosopumilus sp.]CAI9832086.1 conserved hypothetical protein [Nitrosopumilaceae archaeon]MDA7941415.1 hypothetical protein [Nitrosopumilus sp.]MDA7952662.1 hypothetical protein [Nitrosopumilus sp.]MDA7954424.1 hypothetical protein [Nitrosopumilus sp.]
MPEHPVPWYGGLEGVAYRYYDLRMNIVPLVGSLKEASSIWYETAHWWVDPSIRVRFVEAGERYWFVMGSESRKPASNRGFFKELARSEHYERFKRGHGGEAYLRFGTYDRLDLAAAKKRDVCDCGHEAGDHDEGDGDACLFYECSCRRFSSLQVRLFKRRKTITDILFLDEGSARGDQLAWNCLESNKYSLSRG